MHLPNTLLKAAQVLGFAAQRETIGSALAYGWREALGEELPEEIIIYPGASPKRAVARQHAAVAWPNDLQLEAFPNPSVGPVYITYEVPEGIGAAELRIMDVTGRELWIERLPDGPGIRMVQTDQWSAGLYVAELRVDGKGFASTKLTVH
jgi:hypothetical protein